MEIGRVYQEIKEILDGIDFSVLYPGFKKYKFALYNKNEVCFDGAMRSYEKIFCGNTSIEYQGEYTAIWNMDYEDEVDVEILTYGIIHEMYHCFQRENGEERFSDDLKLLNYPFDLENYINKYQENKYLVDAFINTSEESLKAFFEIRNFRSDKYRDYLLEEFRAETVEGMAEFIGLKGLKMINEVKYQKKLDEYLEKLEADIPLLFDIRQISYFTGAVFYLTMEKLGHKIRNEFGERTVFEQNRLYTECFHRSGEYPEISKKYQEFVEERRGKIKEHIAGKTYVEYPAGICGYDPVNMFRVDNLILCKNFICLKNETGSVNLAGPVVIKLKENSDEEIEGYY